MIVLVGVFEHYKYRDSFAPVFSPACEQPQPAPSSSSIPLKPQVALEKPSELYPLDARYNKAHEACGQATCLAPRSQDRCKEKTGCCSSSGSYDTFETLQYQHVVFFRLATCNTENDFHRTFWPFFWWTAVFEKSDFAILLDRSSCFSSSFWLDELFWAVAKAKEWKVINMSNTTNYCVTGELHLLRGLRQCCAYALGPAALLRRGQQLFLSAVLGAEAATIGADRHLNAVIYTRHDAETRRILEPEKLLPLFRKDREPGELNVKILDDMPTSLLAQARLFAATGLVLAPTGSWSPNVMFMPSDAWPEEESCLVGDCQYHVGAEFERGLLHLFSE
eukprot:Skav225802  [mRNA]  locus=scaffold5154:103755:107891:+ [translate_table: standard]